MRLAQAPTRRGIALLLALVALSILSLAGVGILRTASTTRLERTFATKDAADLALVRDLSRLILARLREHDGPIADPALLQPGAFMWLEQQLDVGMLIRVRAIDLCGRLRIDKLATFAASGVPLSVRQAVRDDIELIDTPPRPLLEAMLTDSMGGRGNASARMWLTAHGSGALNIHTAPLPLLRATLIGLEPTIASQAVAARANGDPVPSEVAQRIIAERRQQRRGDGEDDRFLALTDRSDSLGYAITIERKGMAPRAWWIVASFEPATQRQAASWRIVEQQRGVFDAP